MSKQFSDPKTIYSLKLSIQYCRQLEGMGVTLVSTLASLRPDDLWRADIKSAVLVHKVKKALAEEGLTLRESLEEETKRINRERAEAEVRTQAYFDSMPDITSETSLRYPEYHDEYDIPLSRAMLRNGLSTVGDVVNFGRRKILDIPGIGRKYMSELEGCLGNLSTISISELGLEQGTEEALRCLGLTTARQCAIRKKRGQLGPDVLSPLHAKKLRDALELYGDITLKIKP